MDGLLFADDWGEVEAPIDPLAADFTGEDTDLGDADEGRKASKGCMDL